MSYPSFVTRRLLAIVLFAVFGLGVASALVVPRLPVGGPLGAWMANREIAQGTYAYKAPLSSVAWSREWKRIMHCEYGIQIKDQGPISFQAAFRDSYNEAYNRVQLAAIESRFGSNVVFTTRDRLRQAWSNKTAKS
ncbi:hypothetical protein BH09VER1_BH09VER1_43550 [soil metagenome]